MNKNYNILLGIVAVAVVVAGVAFMRQAQLAQDNADNQSVRTIVTQFGSTMQKVSLAAPDTLQQIDISYAAYATSSLIAKWKANPSFAPGRGLSSPWPSGIEVKSITKNSDGTYAVLGTVDEITSNEAAHGGIAAQFPITLTLTKYKDTWLISSYEAGAENTLTKTSTTTAR